MTRQIKLKNKSPGNQRGTKDPVHPISSVQLLSCVRLFAIPWIAAHQAPLSMGFSRQTYWSGMPFLSPGDLPSADPHLLHWQVNSLPLSHLGSHFPTLNGTKYIQSVQLSNSVISDSLRPHGLQHTRPLCSSPTPGVYLNSCPLSQ